MRLRIAKRFSFLIVFLASLTVLCQGITAVSANAAGSIAFSTLVSDYYSFSSPQFVAVSDDYIAVYDDGIVIFEGDAVYNWDFGANLCFGIEILGDYLFALVGEDEDNYTLRSYDIKSGAAAPYAYNVEGSHIFDISVYNSHLFILIDCSKVACYTLSQSELVADYEIALSSSRWSSGLCVCAGGIYLETISGNIIKYADGTFSTELTASAINGMQAFTAYNSQIYMSYNGSVYADSLTSAPLISEGEGDDKLSSLTDFMAFGSYLYIVDGAYKAIKVFDCENGAFVKHYGSYGSGSGRFNNPVSIDSYGSTIAVADRANNRVLRISGDSVNTLSGYELSDVSEVTVARDGDIFVVDGGAILRYSGNTYSAKYTVAGEVVSMAVASDGTAYASVGSKVYRLKSGETQFSLFMDLGYQIYKLKFGIGGNVLYACSGSVIQAYTKAGEKLSVFVNLVSNPIIPIDFDVDYYGNVYVVSADALYRFERQLNGYAAAEEFSVAEDRITPSKVKAVSLTNSGTMYIISDHNILVFDSSEVSAKLPTDISFTPTGEINYPIAICTTLLDTIAYNTPDNFEDISILEEGGDYLLFDNVTYLDNDYYRIEAQGKSVYVAVGDVEVKAAEAADINRARCLHTVKGVNIYRYPSATSDVLYTALPKTEVFDIVSALVIENGGDVWRWYEVGYNNARGYVLAADVVAVDDEPEVVTRYAAKIKSDKLGKTVAVYGDASVESVVVARLADGTQIDMLETLSQDKEFIKVLYDGEICYVQSSNLTVGGLTSGQILAIVLSVITVTATVVVLLISRASRRRKI